MFSGIGELSVSTSSATQIYNDVDIPAIAEFMRVYDESFILWILVFPIHVLT